MVNRIKRRLALLLALLCLFAAIAGCKPQAAEPVPSGLTEELAAAVDRESEAAFRFFWREASSRTGSPGYGLIADRAPGNPGLASVAATGFGLAALPIGVERGWVGKREALERAGGTLDTLLLRAAGEHGFLYHFLDQESAARSPGSELSIIDTAIAVCGALTAGSYFGGEVAEKAQRLYERVDWLWFRDEGNNQFYMGYSPENGFSGHWDYYAEQLMLYILGAGSPTHPVGGDMFYAFTRDARAYGEGRPFIHSWFGSLFTHQFSHAWIDFRGLRDREGVDWWNNSVVASEASRDYAVALKAQYPSFGEQAWGLTASDSPTGYNGLFGSPPSGSDDSAHRTDGTLAPAGALGSMPFTPEASGAALLHYLSKPELWGEYGLADAYNEEANPPWVDPDVIGIDKGITLLMLENYRSGLIWKLFMKLEPVKAGIRAAELSPSSSSADS